MEVHQSKKGLVLDQHKYAMDFVEMSGLQCSTVVDIPLEVNIKLDRDTVDLLLDAHITSMFN